MSGPCRRTAAVFVSDTPTVSWFELKPLTVIDPLPVSGPAALANDHVKINGLLLLLLTTASIQILGTRKVHRT